MDAGTQGAIRLSSIVLLAGHTLAARAVLQVAKAGLKLPDDALATASFTLAPGAARVETGDWLRIATPQGKRMVMMVTAASWDTDGGEAQSIECEHVFAILRDSLCGKINEEQADMAAPDALRALFACQKEPLWQLGTCEYADALPWSFKGCSVYDNLQTVTDCLDDPRWELDTDALPFTAHLVRHSDAPMCEMRMARNLSAVRVRRERAGMFTRLYPLGMDEMTIEAVNDGLPYIEKNADKHGIIEKTLTAPAIDNPRVLLAWAQAQLDKACAPTVSITLTGRELSQRTGVALDRLTVGTVCRAAIRGGPISARIVQLEWKNAEAEPEAVTVTLSSKRRTMQSVARRLQAEIGETRRGGGGSGAKQKTENEKLWTSITQTEEKITQEAYRLDERIDGQMENIARLTVTADEIEGVVAKHGFDSAGDLLEQYYSQITQNADNILLRVAYSDFNGENIASLINVGTGEVLIQANRINLSGYVTASQLEAEIANIKITDSSYVTTAALSTQALDADYGEFAVLQTNTLRVLGSTMSFFGKQLGISSTKVVISVSGKSTSEIAVRDASGTIIGTAISGYKVSYSTATINYIGWAEDEGND